MFHGADEVGLAPKAGDTRDFVSLKVPRDWCLEFLGAARTQGACTPLRTKSRIASPLGLQDELLQEAVVNGAWKCYLPVLPGQTRTQAVRDQKSCIIPARPGFAESPSPAWSGGRQDPSAAGLTLQAQRIGPESRAVGHIDDFLLDLTLCFLSPASPACSVTPAGVPPGIPASHCSTKCP